MSSSASRDRVYFLCEIPHEYRHVKAARSALTEYCPETVHARNLSFLLEESEAFSKDFYQHTDF